MKILVFGTGDYYERYKNFFIDDVVGLIDNNKNKQGSFLNGKEIMSPETAVELKYDRIYVLSVYFLQMTEQLLALGIDKEKIFSPTEVIKLIKEDGKNLPLELMSMDCENLISIRKIKNILMLTPDLKLNGSVIALLGAVRACLKEGYEVTVGAIQSGPAKNMLVQQYGVKVVIDENLIIHTMAETKWVRAYNIILCNTILMYQFLSDRNSNIPIIWWLHDPPYVYRTIDHEIAKRIDFSNVQVYGAGKIAAEAFEKEFPDQKADILLFGLEDKFERTKHNDDLFTVITVGEVQDWKGQDIFCGAAKRLLQDMGKTNNFEIAEKSIRFLIIGNDSTKFASKLKEEYGSFPEIRFVGILPREEMSDIYQAADLYICPSREETMSITVSEAMMNEVPCIISNAAGISEFIEEEKNGMLFNSGNASDLKEKISWCLSNREKAKEIGINGRKVFEKNFSEKVFANNIMKILERKGALL